MKTKYVIINEVLPILFTEGHQHAHFSEIGKVTSAGFCAFDQHTDGLFRVSCWGESISLKIKSNPEWDAYLIKKMLEN